MAAVKYRGEFKDITGTDWLIDIWDPTLPIETQPISMVLDDNPLTIEYLTAGDNILDYPIKGSMASIRVRCDVHFQYISLQADDEMVYPVEIFADNILYWRGYVSTDYTEPYDALPYIVTITATDGLGLLKFMPYEDDGDIIEGREFLAAIVLDCISKINTDWLQMPSYEEFINLYEDRISDTVDDSPLKQVLAERYLWNEMSYYDVLQEILRTFNAIIRQEGGYFTIMRPYEALQDTIAGRLIDYTVSPTTIAKSPIKYLNRDNVISSDLKDTEGGMMMYRGAVAKSTINQDYGDNGSWIKNSEFDAEDWEDKSAFRFWKQTPSIVNNPVDFTPPNESNVFTDEESGVIIKRLDPYPSPFDSHYLYQEFGPYIRPTDNKIELRIEYEHYNSGELDWNAVLNFRIKVVNSNVWITNTKVGGGNSKSVLRESTVPGEYSKTHSISVKAESKTGTITESYFLEGITTPGPYEIYIYSQAEPSVISLLKSIKMRPVYTPIIGKTLTKGKRRGLRGFIGRLFAGAFYSLKLTDVYGEPVEIISVKEYTSGTKDTGVVNEYSHNLGDVVIENVDNIFDQFDGALSVEAPESIRFALDDFVSDYYNYFLSGDVMVSREGTNKLRFTGTTTDDFSGTTFVLNTSGTLDGTAATIQPASGGTPEIWAMIFNPATTAGQGKVVLNITGVGSYKYDIEYLSGINAMVDTFIANEGLNFNARGFNISRVGSDLVVEHPLGNHFSLTFELDWGDLSGYGNRLQLGSPGGQVRIDEITFNGQLGTATVYCDNHSGTLTYTGSTIEVPTETWHTRDNSEGKPILQLILDERMSMESIGRQFLQLSMYETDTFYSNTGSIIDPINVDGDGEARVFYMNRGTYEPAVRAWSVDLVEIGRRELP